MDRGIQNAGNMLVLVDDPHDDLQILAVADIDTVLLIAEFTCQEPGSPTARQGREEDGWNWILFS